MNSSVSIVHTDFFGCYNLWPNLITNKNPELNLYKYIIDNVCNNLLIPTFNYEFCRTKYSSSNITSELGSFSEFFRKNMSVFRSFDPIFCFNSNKPQKFITRNKITAFDNYSDFGNIDNENGKITYIGTKLNFISTFIHRVEFEFDVNYRYKKKFEGKYKYNNKIYDMSYCYKVWPKTDLPLEYDTVKINKDLIKNNILIIKETKNDYYLMYCEVKKFKKYLYDNLVKDPYYLLSDKTKYWVEKKINKLKRSFVLEDFEKA